jgi:chromosome partitioning protein
MREYFGDLIFDTVIHQAVRLAEAPSAGESVMTYDRDCRGAREHIELADEVCGHEAQSGIAKTSFVNI